MRKSRFLCMLCVLLLLLFCIVASGCQGEEPPAELPAEPPAEEQPPEKEPLVIEQGEIIVSEYWKNDEPAVNPCPEAVDGTPLKFEQIGYLSSINRLGYEMKDRLYAADDLSEAAAMIENGVYDDKTDQSFEELCLRVGQIDFSQFRLLMFIEYYGSGSVTHWYRLDGLIHDGRGILTRMMFNTVEGDRWITHDTAHMARFVLVRRADYDAPDDRLVAKRYTYTYPPNVIEPGEVTVSDFWSEAVTPQNLFSHYCNGTALQFEQIGLVAVSFERNYGYVPLIGDLSAAAALIDALTYYDSETCHTLNELVSHVDFEQFYLLMVEENCKDPAYMDACYLHTLIYDGFYSLHGVYVYYDNAGYPYKEGGHKYVRLILVRRADLDTVRSNMNYIPHR